MKMNRRNVLAGLGGLAVGGGALLGSGAFSSVEAQRDVQVNVTQDIANVEQVADVLLNVGGYDEIAVIDSDGNTQTNGDGLTPTSSPLTVSNGTTTSFSNTDYVSLVENDVEIVFGHTESISGDSGEHRLPPNATTTFGDLIALVNENTDGTIANPMDIAFGKDVGNTGLGDPPSVQIVDDSGPSISSGYPNDVEIASDSVQPDGISEDAIYDVEVTTGTDDDDTDEEFGIAVGTSDSLPDVSTLLGS
ncbi:MAG: hypothetical protein ABEH88_01795 [Halobacteriales archaeon]